MLARTVVGLELSYAAQEGMISLRPAVAKCAAIVSTIESSSDTFELRSARAPNRILPNASPAPSQRTLCAELRWEGGQFKTSFHAEGICPPVFDFGSQPPGTHCLRAIDLFTEAATPLPDSPPPLRQPPSQQPQSPIAFDDGPRHEGVLHQEL